MLLCFVGPDTPVSLLGIKVVSVSSLRSNLRGSN